MPGRLEGKVALISGAGSCGPGWSNGRAAAALFARGGGKIFAVNRSADSLAESFERIHRSNLVGMGILPVEFTDGMTREALNLDGSESFDITGIGDGLEAGMTATLIIHRAGSTTDEVPVRVRIDTGDEATTVAEGGILHRIYRNLPEAA